MNGKALMNSNRQLMGFYGEGNSKPFPAKTLNEVCFDESWFGAAMKIDPTLKIVEVDVSIVAEVLVRLVDGDPVW